MLRQRSCGEPPTCQGTPVYPRGRRVPPIYCVLPRWQQKPETPEQDRGLASILGNTRFSDHPQPPASQLVLPSSLWCPHHPSPQSCWVMLSVMEVPFPLGKDGQWYQSYELRLSSQVSRHDCHKNETYRVLSEKEGEEEVLLWHQRFLSLTTG